jgi:hypothetical protein
MSGCCCFEVVFSSKLMHDSSFFCGIVRQLASVLSLKSKLRGAVVQGCQISMPLLTPTTIRLSQVLHRGNLLILSPIVSSTPLPQVGWKVSFTTPTTCNSSGGDNYDKADDDNYSSSSSSWDNGSCLAERLERLLAAASVAAASVKRRRRRNTPLALLWMGIKLKGLGLSFQ